ncbi:MAG: 4'-phosphopantetheinyl transferase superfamily protein [Myxococcales bacterium]|nr:4'-phosphopantetheinyl transferase superfamily protein [Myxococcales bacterium]
MTVSFLEQRLADVPGDDDWLGPAEREVLRGLTVAKRRAQWRLGRWTAKQALVSATPGLPRRGTALEIRAADDGAPQAFVGSRPLRWALSLSHRDDRGVCALAPAHRAVGCDLERIEPRSEAFVADVFTEAERARLPAEGRARWRLVAAQWSAKESLLKALRVGLRRDTRSVAVCSIEPPNAEGWGPLQVEDHASGRRWPGWWRPTDDHVLTVVGSSLARRPRALLR